MRWMERLRMRFKMLVRRGRESQRLDAELQFHIEQQTAENIAAGMLPEEARQAAMRAFGNSTLLREQAHETWSWTWAELLLRDLRYGIRTLTRTPGFSMIAVIVMALGIGATVALFTVVHSVLLKPLPFPAQNRLVMIYEADSQLKFRDSPVAGGTFKSWQQGSHSFTQMALITDNDYNLSESGGQLPERLHAQTSSWNLLSTLGVQPALGRLFAPADDKPGANETTVIAWGFWKRRFGADPQAIGSTILLNAKPYTIIGVLPAWFHYPDTATQIWTTIYPEVLPQDMRVMESHDAHNFQVVGRLKPGVTLAQAQAELSSISAQEARQYNNPFVFDAVGIRPLLDSQVHNVRTALYALLGATGCLLLIACLNVANLLVARCAARRKESAIRAALGGSRGRRIRGQVTESVVLSVAGGLLGTAFAYGTVRWLVHVRADLPRAESIHVDAMALFIAIGIAAACGLAAGLIPALAEDDRQVLRTLNESSRTHSGGQARGRLRRALLSVEIGLTVVLLVGAGLLLKSYQRLHSVNLGCNARNVLTMDIGLPDTKYDTPLARFTFFEQLLERIRQLPGVNAAALTTALPGQGQREDDGFTIHEDPPLPKGQALDADVRFVDPGYFATMQIPLLRGRAFLPEERGARNKYAIISESLDRQLFAGRNPIGKHIDDENNAQQGERNASNEIIGVVGDTRESAAKDPVATIYYPLYSGLRTDATLAVRTHANPLGFALPVQKNIASMDPNLAVSDILTLDQVVGHSTVDASFDATLLLVLAVLSLVLAAVGLFGVLSYVVAQRTGEIGIRIALGAQREQVLRLVLADGLRPAVLGLVAGLIASVAVTRLIASMLYGTDPLDPVVFLLVTATLLAVATVACALPAWRASRLNPMTALRRE